MAIKSAENRWCTTTLRAGPHDIGQLNREIAAASSGLLRPSSDSTCPMNEAKK
jgi:hypothetical protein